MPTPVVNIVQQNRTDVEAIFPSLIKRYKSKIMSCSILIAEKNGLFNLSNSICLRKQSRTFVPVILDDRMEMDELDSLQNSPKACDEFSDKAVVRSYNIVKIKGARSRNFRQFQH